jgi:hypothetical protein
VSTRLLFRAKSTNRYQIFFDADHLSIPVVSWNTFAQLSNPTVSYGISPDALTQTASSSVSVTYPTSLTYNNHVNVTGLLPYTTYYYLPQYSNATTPYNFTTSRASGDATPFTAGVVIDMVPRTPLPCIKLHDESAIRALLDHSV